jgi:3-deoxy-D-manno-octulosonic-acid transferase
MFLLYNLLLTLLSPLWVPWMLYRAWRRNEKPNWKERQGDYPLRSTKESKRVWFHAVSVGEVVAATPILRELRSLLPDHEIVLSVTTSSGHRTAREHAVDLYDHLVYFPIDVARFQLAAMQRVRPKVVAVMETELWMNFLWAAKTFDAKTVLVNGRISDRSFPRSMKLRRFYQALLVQVDRCLMQSPTDAERIQALGAQEAEVLGNCKFDQAVQGLEADPAKWRRDLGIPEGKAVVVVGSTRGEDEQRLVVEALKRVGPDRAWVVHAPRHLETVDSLAREVEAAFGQVARRSQNEQGPYLILDTYGELSEVYAIADVVVIGGGFANLGGQNLLQPLAHGKPVLHGPHMQNFRDVTAMAQAAGASIVCDSSESLAKALLELLDHPEQRQSMGAAARELVRANVGASRRYAQAIAEAAT